MSTNTPNTIDLYLMENRSIMAKVNGYPIGNQNGYLIIAGEENATQFKIASIPDIYSGYTLSVEMVNSRGAGIEEKEIEDNTFVLPEGMAVAGYGQIQIYAKKTVSGREIKVPFNLIRVKVSNTISTWEESISPGAVESAKKSAAEAKSYAESAKKDSESAATAASVAESSKEAAESAAQEATQSAQSAAESASTAQNAAEEAVNTLEGKADLAGNNDFTGENTFEEAIQAKKGTVVKNSLDETNYNAGYISRNDWTYLFPADSGTFALTKNIPTDYATQTALANTQRQVDGLYTLLEQKNEIYVQTATDTYTTRETAGGENIADGVQTPVKKITGKTVKTTNLIPYPYYNPSPTVKNGITFTVNEDYSVTANGTATADANYILVINSNPILLDNSKAYTLSGCPSGGGDSTYRIYIQDTSFSKTYIDRGDGMTFTPKNTEFYVYITISNGVTINNLVFKPMLNEGSTALPYMPYFSGLKNAFFKEIVSTGKNLIPYPYTDGTKTLNGVTFTVNNDGTITVNGTATSLTVFFIADTDNNKIKLSLGVSYSLSGCPVGGDDKFSLNVQTTSYNQIFTDFGNGYSGVTRYTDYYAFITISQGYTANNLVFKPMLNEGSTALPYEPYTQSVLSLPEAVELTEYDTAYPETGEIQRQSNTLTFNGTENWYVAPSSNVDYFFYTTSLPGVGGGVIICDKLKGGDFNTAYTSGVYVSGNDMVVYFLKSAYPNLSTTDEWKAQLAAWNEAGNPLTVTYKTAEITTEQADFSADSYIAWKNGSETIEQGNTDNSIYGAENTVEQDYYLLTAPEEVTKE